MNEIERGKNQLEALIGMLKVLEFFRITEGGANQLFKVQYVQFKLFH